jgi:D-lactate dehydrogenase (cytochrome)
MSVQTVSAPTASAPATPATPDALLDSLRELLGERLSTSAAVREQHGKDVSFHEGFPPDAVAFAQSTEEVQAIVRLCAAHRTPIVPFGTGTSLGSASISRR